MWTGKQVSARACFIIYQYICAAGTYFYSGKRQMTDMCRRTHQDLPSKSLLPKLRGVPRTVLFAATGEQGAPYADEVTRGLHLVAQSISPVCVVTKFMRLTPPCTKHVVFCGSALSWRPGLRHSVRKRSNDPAMGLQTVVFR